MKIAIDFDETVVDRAGNPFKNSIEVLERLGKKHTLILYTSRFKARRKEALNFLRKNGVQIQEPDPVLNFGRKILADLYVDDKNLLGLPKDKDGDPDWLKIESLINKF